MSATIARPAVTEAALLANVRDLCRLFGFLAYHTHRSERSEPGFPDLVIVGRHGVLFRELKTDRGRVSADQQKWLDGLTAAGANASVWRPGDIASGRVVRELTEIRSATKHREVPHVD